MESNPKRNSCIVIGGGLAGLAAAHLLAKRGWQVTVLEAQDRVGGRVVSYRFPGAPELVCELGGEWIGKDHPVMQRLCKAMGLTLESHCYGFTFWDDGSGNPSRVFPPGAWPFSTQAREGFDAFRERFRRLSRAEKIQLDRIDWWTQLEKLNFSERDLLIRDLMDSTDFGESIRVTSAYAAATEYLEGDATDEMDFKVSGGNDRLARALAEDLHGRGQRVLEKCLVTEIDQDGRAVHVRCANHAEVFSAAHCICAVPARCLNRITWRPALPQAQSEAAEQLQYARITKTVILYNRRFWKTGTRYGFSAFTSRVSDFCFESTFAQPGEQGILCSYAIGEKADDVASEIDKAAVMRWITDDMVGIVQPDPRRLVVPLDFATREWQRDRFSQGAYALYRPGQWFTVLDILRTPHKRVRFAGEHLADWQGFMEGAVETGEQAAEALL